MERTMAIIVVSTLVGALILYFLFRVVQGRIRGRQWRAQAAKMGLSFAAEDPSVLLDFEGFELFGYGSSRSAHRVLRGSLHGAELALMDYHFTISGGRASYTTRQTICILRSSRLELPRLYFRRAGGALEQLVVGPKIQPVLFPDDPSFAQELYVVGPDEAALRQLFDPAVREQLRSYRDSDIQVEGQGDTLLVHFRTLVAPAEVSRLTDQAFYLLEVFAHRPCA